MWRNIVLSWNLSHFCTLLYWFKEQYNNIFSVLNTTFIIAYCTPRVGRPSSHKWSENLPGEIFQLLLVKCYDNKMVGPLVGQAIIPWVRSRLADHQKKTYWYKTGNWIKSKTTDISKNCKRTYRDIDGLSKKKFTTVATNCWRETFACKLFVQTFFGG